MTMSGTTNPLRHKITPPDDIVNPSRYTQGTIEVWDAIEGMGLDYFQGNIVKYVARHSHKGQLEDLKKAQQYLKKLAKLRYGAEI